MSLFTYQPTIGDLLRFFRSERVSRPIIKRRESHDRACSGMTERAKISSKAFHSRKTRSKPPTAGSKLNCIGIMLAAALLLSACNNNVSGKEYLPAAVPVISEGFVFSRENFPRMDGSTSTAPLAQAAACVLLGEPRESVANFAEFNRTTQSFRNLAAGLCDILIVSEPAPEVFKELAEQGFEYEMSPIATDALVFVVNASNPVDSLTPKQIQDIYTGRITNWKDVGGEDLKIEAFQRNAEAGSQVLMEKLVMGGQRMDDAPTQRFQTVFGMGDLITAIKGFDGSASAIGYTVYYYAEDMKMAEGLKIISISGVNPCGDTIRSGEYPFLNSYYTVIGAREPEGSPARIMYNWLLSGEGQSLVSHEGYVSIMEGVKTNYTYLTAYEPAHSKYSRLREGPLPALEPSRDYGILLPYAGASVFSDGRLRESKYGLVTKDGVVVTDLVYDSVETAYLHYPSAQEPRFAYVLSIDLFVDEWSHSQTKAVCALDGSWVTPFDYFNIVFKEDVIFLIKSYEGFDIDVYDYTGKRLYNMRELEWTKDISADAWAGDVAYNNSEGYGFVQMDDKTYSAFDALTGELRRLEYIRATPFSDGLAAVQIGFDQRLWGFIDKNFELAIPPKFVDPAAFVNGKAVAYTPDGSWHIIDNRGETLFTAPPNCYIEMLYESSGFRVVSKANWERQTLYTKDLVEISFPASIEALAKDTFERDRYINHLGGGWYSCEVDGGMVLFTEERDYFIPGAGYISQVDGESFVYIEYDGAVTRTGVMALDGTVIIPPEQHLSIIAVTPDSGKKAFIVNTGGFHIYGVGSDYIQSSYKLIGADGAVIVSGSGAMAYNEGAGLYSVLGVDHFAWLDLSGNTIISIPLMSYTLD